MEYQQAAAATATAFSRKLSGGGLSGKHVYDGVFGEGGRVGGRVEDYREIFGGGSSGCSIPVLDVPELNEAKVTLDTRSSSLDYSKIFGGFGDAEFAAPYEKLVLKPKKRRDGSSSSSSRSSSHEARAPAEPRSRVAGEERTTFSGEKNVPSPEASFKSFDGARQFNVSYHMANPGCKSGMNGTTHITQLHAMPGYTCLIDEGTPAVAKPKRSVLNGAHAKINISEGIKDARPPRKAVSGPQPRYNPVDIRKKSSRSKSISDDFSFDAFEVSLATELPRNPPPSGSPRNIRNVRSMNVKFGVTRADASEDIAGNYSPPFLDEEIDENSAAAASAAAVIKAIEEAQMKIQIAKELMERKREGLQNREKLSFSNGVKAEKRQLKLAEKANRSKDGEAWEKFDEGPPSQPFESVFEQEAKKASQVNPGFLDQKELRGDRTAVEGGSQPISIPPVHCVEEARDEMAMRELSEASGSREHGDTPRDYDRTDHAKKIMETAGENECIKKTIMEENINKPEECHDYEVAVKQEDENKLNSAEPVLTWDIYRNSIQLDQESNHLGGNKETISIVHEHLEADQVPNLSCEEENCRSKLKDFQKLEEGAKLKIQELEENKDVKEVNEAVDLAEIDKIQREVHNQENLAALLDEVPEAEEDGRKLHEIHGHEESGKGHQGDGEWVECAMELEEDGNQEWYEAETGIESGNIHEEEVSNVILNDLHDFEESQRVDTINAITDAIQNLEGTDESEKAFDEEASIESCDIHEEEAISVTYDEIQDYEESDRSCSCDDQPEENQDPEETRENMKVFKEDFQARTTKENQEGTCEGVEPEMIKSDIDHRTENENVELIERFFEYHEDLESVDYAYRMDKKDDLSVSEEACVSQEELCLTADVLTLEENGKMRDETELPFESKETGRESKAAEEANDLHGEANFDIATPEKMDTSEPLIVGKSGVPLSETHLNLEQQQEKHQETEYEGSCNREKHAQELICELDENDNDVSSSDIGSISGEKQLDDGVECKAHYDSEKHVEEVAWELGGEEIDEKESEFVTNPENDQKSVESSSEEQSMDGGIDAEAREEPCVFEEKGKDIAMSQERSNSTDKKGEADQNTLTTEERKSEDRPKEMEAEKNHHRKKELIQERDIQKERERIVVERAIREARERAFAEAREKAERAAAEARERLGKASVEANDKLAADKAMEAKIKAERAAVERATAEARERALEKALSEKARMRNQPGKFAAEKSFGASRDDAMKSKDQQCKVSDASGGSRYPDSSNHGVPHSTERCSGPTGESALRCQATLERHQRTAERAAKALAEKNMRDLLAQKEQAERNRLAETLDSEVKRWSSGKERNLRALLSTLQYILGPDSGWQPIPLTDLVATTAVKKAYRKATLFVHPDKLQQRGASTQQKYTCEKVFDLLKEAWNKFSAEER